MKKSDLFPYQLHPYEAEVVIVALRSYLSRQMSGDGAVRHMELLKDELELRLEDFQALSRTPVEVD